MKERKFKWKTVQNDNETGTRSEILEVQNPDNELTKSKTEITSSVTSLPGRRAPPKEPVTLYFSTMVAFGKEKNSAEEGEPSQIQSQANIVANLMLYKQYIHAGKAQNDEVQIDNMPPACDQDVKQGFIAEISAAVRRNESKEVTETGEANRPSCVLQGTTAEFERSSQLAKIKAIRGLSPNKDIEVKLSDKSSSLLASKLNFDCRFKAIDQTSLAVGGTSYDYMRVRES